MSTLTMTGTRIDAVPSGFDTASLSNYLRCLRQIADSKTAPDERRRAENRLTTQFRAKYKPWTDPDGSAEARDLSSTSGITGGFLVPDTVAPTVYRAIAERSLVRRRATTFKVTGAKTRVPVLAPVTPTEPGQSPFFGGFLPRWSPEASPIPESEPAFNAAELGVYPLVGTFGVSAGLLNTVANFDSFAIEIMAGAVSAVEEWEFLNGNGIGKPLGIRNSGALLTTAARGGSGAIVKADIHKLWAGLLPSSKPTAVWAAGVGAEQQALVDIGAAVTPAPADSGAAYSYLGRPFVTTERCPALNVKGDLVLIDPRYYLIGDGGLEISASSHYDFRNNCWWFRVISMVGGMPWVNTPITLVDGSTQVSPFVALGTA